MICTHRKRETRDTQYDERTSTFRELSCAHTEHRPCKTVRTSRREAQRELTWHQHAEDLCMQPLCSKPWNPSGTLAATCALGTNRGMCNMVDFMEYVSSARPLVRMARRYTSLEQRKVRSRPNIVSPQRRESREDRTTRPERLPSLVRRGNPNNDELSMHTRRRPRDPPLLVLAGCLKNRRGA